MRVSSLSTEPPRAAWKAIGETALLIRPMIGEWAIPSIERVAALESRRLAVLPVPGLSGDLQQDLGRGALAVEITGSLQGDESRDEMLAELRAKFLAGQPVDFVADIVNESELERVVVEVLDLEEAASELDTVRFRVVLREYTEPPEPPPSPGIGADFGTELDTDLDLEAALGLDLLDLPAILVPVPDLPALDELLSPIEPAAEGLRETLREAAGVFDPLRGILVDD